MLIPSNDKRHIYEALTRHNYFPNQKESIRELPPCFSTDCFTPEIAELLASLKQDRGSLGYDQITYSVTRHNNVPRTLSLIHPRAYALLAKSIHDNWDDIKYITKNEQSIIKPYQHLDGRMLVMNYESFDERAKNTLANSFSQRFKVHSE